MLTPEEKNRAIEVMHEYLTAPRNPDGRSPLEIETEFDRNRVRLIEDELRPLVVLPARVEQYLKKMGFHS